MFPPKKVKKFCFTKVLEKEKNKTEGEGKNAEEVEGELRYNLVGPKLIGIIHKKPAEGGLSAVGILWISLLRQMTFYTMKMIVVHV